MISSSFHKNLDIYNLFLEYHLDDIEKTIEKGEFGRLYSIVDLRAMHYKLLKMTDNYTLSYKMQALYAELVNVQLEYYLRDLDQIKAEIKSGVNYNSEILSVINCLQLFDGYGIDTERYGKTL